MRIDYEKIIRKYLEPKLAHHGFKYDVEASSPPTGILGSPEIIDVGNRDWVFPHFR